MRSRLLYWFGIEGGGERSLIAPAALTIATAFVLLFVAIQNMQGEPNTKRSRTLAALSVVRNGLNEYNLTFGSFPPTLQELVQAKILEPGKVRDGWQRPLIYQPLTERRYAPFLLFSVGPDGIPLTPDDVTLSDPPLRQ